MLHYNWLLSTLQLKVMNIFSDGEVSKKNENKKKQFDYRGLLKLIDYI